MTVADPVLPEYLWLVVCCALASFFLGLGVGANDVGNSFATVVGSRTLSLRTAILIAIVFETAGSLLLGRTITSTIQGGIADINVFTREPQVYAYGMLCAVTTTGVWQLVAQYYELNVASGQSLIGSIIGFSLVYGGRDAVLWMQDDPASFPPYKGMVPIILTWFISPVFTAIAAALLFWFVRTAVLRRKNAAKLAFWVLPPAVIVTSFVCIFFLLTKGAKKYISETNPSWSVNDSAWVSAVCAAGLGVLTAIAVLPLLRWLTNKHMAEQDALAIVAAGAKDEGKDAENGAVVSLAVDSDATSAEENAIITAEAESRQPMWKRAARKVWFLATYGTSMDVHASITEDETVADMHANAEVFDSRAEHVFTYLQVFSAICVMFAHGAGEVGYMAGPLSTCWTVYTEGKLLKSVEAPIWTIIIGTVAMCVGLVTVGYLMIIAMGVKLATMTPSRGFCAELATALVTLVASQWGLPTGGSQCIVGAIVGVGLLEANLKGVNWKFFLKQFAAWVVTIFLMGITCAALFAQGIYAPGKIEGASQIQYENSLSSSSVAMFDNYRAVLDSYRPAVAAGLIPRMDTATLDAQSAALKKYSSDAKAAAGASVQTVKAEVMIAYMNRALSLYQSDSVLTVGQTTVFPGALECNSNTSIGLLVDNSTATAVACKAPQLLPKGVASTWPPK